MKRIASPWQIALTVAFAAVVVPVHAAVVPVPVGNGSFETLGVKTGNWYGLPVGGDWTDGNPGNIIDILDVSGATTHFPTNGAPDGDHVFNLSTSSPITQDLSFAINVGDMIEVSLYLGNSLAQADPPSDPTVFITLDAADAYSETVDNTSGDGLFVLKTVQWTATSAGNLGLKISGSAGTWLDDISVQVTEVPAPAALPAGLAMVGLIAMRRRH